MNIALAPMALAQYRTKPEDLGYKNDVRTMMSRVRQIGYDAIETAVPAGFSREEFKALMEEVGLAVITGGGVRHPEIAGNDFKEKIADCKALGAQNVMVSCMPNLVLGNPEELKKFIKNLNNAGKIFQDEGIHLSYHNHAVDFSRIGGRTILEQIVEGTDERYVNLEPDTHWLQAGGGHVISWLKKLKGRIFIVHFKDYGIDQYSDHTFLECTHKIFAEIGEGNLNWPGILQECRDQGIRWCAIEQDRVQRPGYEAIALSLKNLKAFGA
ncbi:MAG: sugar phosphate isomerase/epimerase [Treponema sp.]|jgi:sugar phosphate isomerase/epimerase|nr:sugar phosphate isomerase/epimerase [Treponema sp.]